MLADPRSLSDAEFDALCYEMFDVRDAIQAQPARTNDGLAVKARIAARYLQAPDDWDLALERITLSLVADILRLNEKSRPEGAAAVLRGHAAPGRS
ncbi:hypothetical protein AA309_23880 [Microvirga vignae]|uniref:Uncharacterized protein n=1 Tax=Microvirga vignae TaxID=1225564 RepID=A0A0H1RDR4_9HYPH|nr:hypothetical protein [Microvirga vignae]KLK90752.1 hypothetical protein AA309_23880 [Microvirga vignae]